MATVAPPRGSPVVNLSRRALRSTGRMRLRLAVLALATALPAAGLASCDILDDDQDLPNTARVEITGSSPGPLELVVSDNFERVANIDQGARYTVLVQSDTSLVQPDFAMDYDIEGIHRFYVKLTNHSSEVAQVTLLVAFDGEVGYTQRANISEGGALEFSEIFYGT